MNSNLDSAIIEHSTPKTRLLNLDETRFGAIRHALEDGKSLVISPMKSDISRRVVVSPYESFDYPIILTSCSEGVQHYLVARGDLIRLIEVIDREIIPDTTFEKMESKNFFAKLFYGFVVMFEFSMEDSFVALDLGVLRVMKFDAFWFLWGENPYFGASSKLDFIEYSEWAALRTRLVDALNETMHWEMQKQRLESRGAPKRLARTTTQDI